MSKKFITEDVDIEFYIYDFVGKPISDLAVALGKLQNNCESVIYLENEAQFGFYPILKKKIVREETDKEYNKRLAEEKREQERKLKREEKERKQYERLKAKFEEQK